MNPFTRLLASRRRLTRSLGLVHELHQLNDSIRSVLIHFSIPTLAERAAAEAAAAAEASRLEHDPSLLSHPSDLERLLDSLRERHKQHEPIDDDEIMAAARALDDDEKGGVW